MQNELILTLDEIQLALDELFNECKSRGLHSIKFSHFEYWQINPDEAFALTFPEPQLGVGDILDDAEAVKNLEKFKFARAGQHLLHIANLLNYMGSKYPSLAPEGN